MADSFKYQLTVRVEVAKVHKDGAYTADRLSVDESLTLKPTSFVEAMSVLGRFHELAEKIRVEQ